MTLIMRTIFGDESIAGYKWPMEIFNLPKLPDENEHSYKCREWVARKKHEKRLEDKKYKDMNPDGFWEGAWTVAGLRISLANQDFVREQNKKGSHICKIVSGGLRKSNPKYIKQIIYMLRPPREVAKSQERLTRHGIVQPGTPQRVDDEITEVDKVHSPEKFIKDTVAACIFFMKNPKIPIHFIRYGDLIMSPMETLERLGEKLRVDMSKANDVINPKLKRSEPENVPNHLWDDADYIYNKLSEASDLYDSRNKKGYLACLQSIVDFVKSDKSKFRKSKIFFVCPRKNGKVNNLMCDVCRSNVDVMKQYKKTRMALDQREQERCESEGVKYINNMPWDESPCLYECGMDIERDTFVSIEDSIKENFWRTEDDDSIQ